MTDAEHVRFCHEMIEDLKKCVAENGVAAAREIAKRNRATAWGSAWLARDEQIHAPMIEYSSYLAKRSSELGLDTTATIRKLARDGDARFRELERETVRADNLSRTPIDLAPEPESVAEPVASAVVDVQLDALAKAHAAERGVSFAKAYAEVMASDEGRALYASRALPEGAK